MPLLSETVGYDRAKKHFRNNKEKLKTRLYEKYQRNLGLHKKEQVPLFHI